MEFKDFNELATLFNEHGFDLYLVGGSVRDYLMFSSFDDADCVTNAFLDDIKKFLEVKQEYKKFQSGKFIFNNKVFDITHLRKEEKYLDFRHPSLIEMVNDPLQDYSRRDFTINALYMDKDGNLLDFVNGKNDLNNRIIKMIGDPDTRIKEDPLRILRAIRFAHKLKFDIDVDLRKAIIKNAHLLKELKNIKIQEELIKINLDISQLNLLLEKYGIRDFIPLKKYEKYSKSIRLMTYKSMKSKIEIVEEIMNFSSFIIVMNINSYNDFLSLFEVINVFKNYIKIINEYDDIINNINNNIITIIPNFSSEFFIDNSNIENKLLDCIYFKENRLIKGLNNEVYFDLKEFERPYCENIDNNKNDKYVFTKFINTLKKTAN